MVGVLFFFLFHLFPPYVLSFITLSQFCLPIPSNILFSPIPCLFPPFSPKSPNALSFSDRHFPQSLYLHPTPPFHPPTFCFSFSPPGIILNEFFPGSYIRVLLTDSLCRILKRRYILANNVPKESYLSALLHSSLPCPLPSPYLSYRRRGSLYSFVFPLSCLFSLVSLFSLYLLGQKCYTIQFLFTCLLLIFPHPCLSLFFELVCLFPFPL